ncbi:hypothetical protein, partial [Acetobacter malorum]|uniref:hypothetical protein n=1 Tax=Acetobacter malorum TaxID=178901 RepID=UPI0039EBF795
MQTYGTFFWLRFRYFLYSCRLLIFRRWQWLLVLSLLLPSQALRTIPAVPGHFLNVITSENIGIAGRIWILLSALAVACLWIMPQTNALRGYNDRSFFSTYPLSRTFLTTVTAGLIFISDSIFIVLAVANPAIYRFDAHTPIGLKLSVLLLEFLSFIIFQLGIIEYKKILIISPIISVLPMSAGLQETNTVFRWIFIFISLTILLAPLVSLGTPATRPHKKPNSANIKFIYYNAITRRITPRVRIQIKSLTEHPVLLSVIILTACGLLIGSIMLLKIFKYDDRTFFTLATGLSATAIVLSCLY